MNNRIKCLLACGKGPNSPKALSQKINCELKLLQYFIEHTSDELPLTLAQDIADCYEVPLQFVLGLPFSCELKNSDIDSDMLADIKKAKDEKAYLEFLWKKGYFKDRSSEFSSYKGKAFVAMCFRADEYPELKDIREAFKSGIEKAGYLPVIVDEISTNDYITVEIFDNIKKADFLVLDTTVENCGAYYEAGYAKGLGKPVIICCKKSKFDLSSDHFDVRQINHVLWSDYTDLADQLAKRILQTIG